MNSPDGINKIWAEKPPALSEKEKARFMAAKTDETVRNAIAEENRGLIGLVIKRFNNWRTVHRGVEKWGTLSRDDLFHEGFLVLLEVLKIGDFDFKNTFASYAIPSIDRRLRRKIRDNKRAAYVPEDVIEKESKRFMQIKEHAKKRDIPAAQAADELRLSRDSTEGFVSLDDKLAPGSSTLVGQLIKNEGAVNAETIELARAELENVNILIEIILDEIETGSEREIFSARYGNLSQSQAPMDYKKISEKLEGISVYQVKSILNKFWRKLRNKLKNKVPEANVDENWFYDILKQRERLQEFFSTKK